MREQDVDDLDKLLKEGMSHIADDGFSSKVMNALPEGSPANVRTTAILSSAMVAFVVCFLGFSGGDYLIGAVSNVLAFILRPSAIDFPFVSLVLLFSLIVGSAVTIAEGS